MSFLFIILQCELSFIISWKAQLLYDKIGHRETDDKYYFCLCLVRNAYSDRTS